MSKVNDYLKNMAESRAKVIAKLQNVPDEAMTLPIPNRDNISVRFIFYRLVAHEIEHTIHLAKTVRSLGVHLSEAEQILEELAESRGKLIGMLSTLTDEELDTKPSAEDWSPREVVDHILEVEEGSYSDQIINALEK
ncbi:MAG: DinB family protein [SAR202 cluster bacterium]|jgi:uncharacterized damage-inducible protein DinB|nr:hypothetical protein [Chloroflexota bacterium]MCH2522497.1 DinB family protein [Dehalococcoidia bacterium]MQG25165.1 DinB family protein [SAR202 cluster bacterium]MQG84923.1 DinB family protein [SAR202 cluster bacterium]|tara:strand:+ start:8145 stop:8555 length:411 start_codon:yes stop_codon:yes gene_type:complete